MQITRSSSFSQGSLLQVATFSLHPWCFSARCVPRQYQQRQQKDFSSRRTSKHFLTKCSQIAIIKLYSDHVERDTHSYNRVHVHTWYTAARTRCTHNWKVREENNPSHGDVPMNHSYKLCHEVPHTEHAFICILLASIINIAIFLKIQTDSLPQKVARSFPLARG